MKESLVSYVARIYIYLNLDMSEIEIRSGQESMMSTILRKLNLSGCRKLT